MIINLLSRLMLGNLAAQLKQLFMLRKISYSLLIVLTSYFVHGQSPSALGKYRHIIKYYPGKMLHDLEGVTGALSAIDYYFNHSYSVSNQSCSGCSLDSVHFYNKLLFDIREFEHNRLQTETRTVEYKGYNIELKSKEVVQAQLGTFSIEQMGELRALRPLPKFKYTGSLEADYASYNRELEKWIRDFPEEYRTLTSSDGLIRVKLEQYPLLADERKVLLETVDYIIIK